MNDNVRKDILSLLNSVIEILESEEENDLIELSELSNHIIHSASIFQDEDSISAALMVYSIYKIFARGEEKKKIYSKIMPIIKQAKSLLEKNDENGFREKIRSIFKLIFELDSQVSIYLDELLDKARLKKGAKIYEHGISLARVAELVGISLWELSSYVGGTKITERNAAVGVEKRLGFARAIFGAK